VIRKNSADFDFGEEGSRFFELSEERITAISRIRNSIVGVSGKRSVENTVLPLTRIDGLLDVGLNQAELMESVHPDEGMRHAAEVSRQKLSKIASELGLDRALYEAVAILENSKGEPELTRYIRHTLRDFRQAGVDRDESTRKRIKEINEELVLLSQEFNRNIRSDTRFIEVDGPDDLDGLPKDYISSHPRGENGTIRITTDYPDFVPFMSYAKRSDLRRALYIEYMNRAYPANDTVLSKILTRRHELASLIGHPSYAAYASADKMIESAENIIDFVEKIAAIAADRSQTDLEALLARKRREDPDASYVEDFEKAYLLEIVRSENLNFDSQEVRPYLEFRRVKEGVLAVTSKLFGLTYCPMAETAWHPLVETYDVYKDKTNIGRFYLDMHPRDAKYKHAAMFPVVSGSIDGHLPEAALVCNFPEPCGASPALLEHSDVVTFFHEFGHLLHHILGGHQSFVRFSGVATEWDFVEVPSQLLEEWAYSYDALRRFAIHHETGAGIPEEMVERLNQARTFGRGARVRQQMFFAALSYYYHASDPKGIDLMSMLKRLQAQYSPYPYMEETHLHTSFGHLEGYSALYYTYMWSLVIARDLFEAFDESGLFHQKVAKRYRECVLEPGGVKDALDLIRDFLGRTYNFGAFKRWVNS
jgi:thimet oligopeptidase